MGYTIRDFYLANEVDLVRFNIPVDFSGCNDCAECPYSGTECHGCSREWMLNDDSE